MGINIREFFIFKLAAWQLILGGLLLGLLDVMTLGNRQVFQGAIYDAIALPILAIAVLSVIIGIIKFICGAGHIVGPASEKSRLSPRKLALLEYERGIKWQPVNVVLGLALIGSILFFCWPESQVMAGIRLIPALILIFTKRNNFLVFIVLLLANLTWVGQPTNDLYLMFFAAIYMFFSSVLRMFRVKRNVLIGLALAVALAAGLYKFFVYDEIHAFVSEDRLTITKEIDSGLALKLSNAENISTLFHPRQGVDVNAKGLRSGAKYACRVIIEGRRVVIPLDDWRIFKGKKGGGFIRYGEFNSGEKLVLEIGDYVIQLVEIEEAKGTIVAETNFSVAPYDDADLSGFTAYLTIDNDPNKYYDSYTVMTNNFGAQVWVQSPKGATIGGTLKFFKTDSENVVEATPWDVAEAFKTDPEGEPVHLRSLGGHIYPGIYHFQIIVDGQVIKDLKLII